jgi:hypothetical protein
VKNALLAHCCGIAGLLSLAFAVGIAATAWWLALSPVE